MLWSQLAIWFLQLITSVCVQCRIMQWTWLRNYEIALIGTFQSISFHILKPYNTTMFSEFGAEVFSIICLGIDLAWLISFLGSSKNIKQRWYLKNTWSWHCSRYIQSQNVCLASFVAVDSSCISKHRWCRAGCARVARLLIPLLSDFFVYVLKNYFLLFFSLLTKSGC